MTGKLQRYFVPTSAGRRPHDIGRFLIRSDVYNRLVERGLQIEALQEAHAEQEEWLHKMDAALKAADELADAATPFVGHSAHVPDVQDRLDAALAAYRKARGIDQSTLGQIDAI